MAESGTLVSVEEYLQTGYKPACEYCDGVLTRKPMPTWNHSQAQSQVLMLINTRFSAFRAGAEVTVRLRKERYLVPDVAVQRRDQIQSPYPTEPIHLCIEVLSPDDRLSAVISKAEEYHTWGVPVVWIIDPENRMAWEFSPKRGLHEVGIEGSLNASPISVPLREILV